MPLKKELLNPVPQTWEDQLAKQVALVGSVQSGVIILADISGYTGLVTQTEIEHSQSILQFLFDHIYEATGERFIVNEIEGDAIFAYAVEPKNPGALLVETLKQLKEYGHAFYHARKQMLDNPKQGSDACDCNACINIGRLSFKFVVHYGKFGVNKVGPFVKLIGADIVLAHRLLKNDVPGHEYVLLTKETLDLLPVEIRAKFIGATESIDKFGDVPVAYRLFDWEEEEAKHHAAT
mgnify:CR=1 FL=1